MGLKYGIGLAIVTIVLLASWGYSDSKALTVTGDSSVSDVMEILGKDLSSKKPNFDLEGVSAEVGEKLFKEGFAPKPDGGKTRRQSKHFQCTSCHNVEKEDPNLAVSDPQARLIYTSERNMPFLQGTTMYGAVNRETYYNGDYDKKYGDLVKPARNDIRGAIHLCAVECAQGRALKDWELESVLAYLWTIGLKVDDLNLSDSEMETINDGEVQDGDKLSLIDSKFLSGSPAHFIPPPVNRKEGLAEVGVPTNGKLIYDGSCLHCHYQGRYSYFDLDDTKFSFRHLKSTAKSYHRHSLYQVTRWGVPTKSGKSSYMPQYPKEKMSNQQLADLMAYISLRAE